LIPFKEILCNRKIYSISQDKDNNIIDDDLGLSSYQDRIIYIRSVPFSEDEIQTLIHEYSHIYLWEEGKIKLERNEEMVNLMTNMIYRFIADNPEIIKFIMEKNYDQHKKDSSQI